MTDDPDAGFRSPKSAPGFGRSRAAVGVALIIGLLFGILLLASVGWLMLSRHAGRTLLSQWFSAVTGRTVSIDVSQPTVVDRIQRLQRLETVIYTMDKVVTGDPS
jgi:hypothetical protein